MIKKKAWSGRFKESTNPLFEKFNASLGFDRRLYKHDILASLAHATMLGRRKIIAVKEAKAIVAGLKKVEAQIAGGKFKFDMADEDIHMAIERRLTNMIGPVAGKLHTGRSRNDQVATDLRLYVREAIDEISALIRDLQKALVTRAKEHIDTIAPAYTHLQPAQPIRLAHWFLAYFEMMERDVGRFSDMRRRVNISPLGSAALAGTNFPVDRLWVAKELGFDGISGNSMDAVSDRDFVAEFLFAVAMMATHLSRLAEELVIYTSAEFGVMELPDSLTTGSSIMPQKKNPDAAELIRGKTGRLTGHLVAILTMLKGLPLAYNKDMQEDKEPVFDAHDQTTISLRLMAEMVGAVKVNADKLKSRAGDNFMTAVDMADGLVLSGMPFRKAHEEIGRFVRMCEERGLKLSDVTGAEFHNKIDSHVLKIILSYKDPKQSTDNKDVPGGTARKRIVARIKKIEREMTKW